MQYKLWNNAQYFDKLINSEYLVNSKTPSPISGMLIGDELKTIAIAKQLQERGFALTTALYPVAPKTKGMLRLT